MDDHFLHDMWSVYFHDPNDEAWDRSSFKKISDISTIENFWQVNNCIHDKIHLGMFFMMRESIFPLWEEKENCNGGYISIKVQRNKVQEVWNMLCARVLSESIMTEPHYHLWDQINGLSVSPKKSFCIFKIWIKTKDINDPSWFDIHSYGMNEILYTPLKLA